MWGGTVVALQTNHMGAGKILFKPQDVANLGTTPRIDRLVIIADAAYISVPLRQHPKPQVLGDVGVLVFVNHHITELALVFLQNVRLVFKQLQTKQEQVAEIRCVDLFQALLIITIEIEDAALGHVGAFIQADLLRRQAPVLPPLDDADYGPRWKVLVVNLVDVDILFD